MRAWEQGDGIGVSGNSIRLQKASRRRNPSLRTNSLLTGKITGNFKKFGGFGESLSATTQENQSVAGKFPTRPNREFYRANREIHRPIRLNFREEHAPSMRARGPVAWRSPGRD